jgi:hypothetical protein
MKTAVSEAFLNKALTEAMPLLRARLGREVNPSEVDLDLLDRVLEALTDDDDPHEVRRLRRVVEALVAQSEGRASVDDDAFDDWVLGVYDRLRGDSRLQKGSIFRFATAVLKVQAGGQVLVVCGPRNDEIAQVFERGVAYLSSVPMRIDAARQLRGEDARTKLDLAPHHRATIDRVRREGGRALLLGDASPEKRPPWVDRLGDSRAPIHKVTPQDRPTWVIDGMEEVAADVASPVDRAAIRDSVWLFVESLSKQGDIQLYEYDSERDLFQDYKLSLIGTAFLLRTSQTADDFWAMMKALRAFHLSIAHVELKAYEGSR